MHRAHSRCNSPVLDALRAFWMRFVRSRSASRILDAPRTFWMRFAQFGFAWRVVLDALRTFWMCFAHFACGSRFRSALRAFWLRIVYSGCASLDALHAFWMRFAHLTRLSNVWLNRPCFARPTDELRSASGTRFASSQCELNRWNYRGEERGSIAFADSLKFQYNPATNQRQ